MANETRPRRESTGTSRIRKSPSSGPSPAPDDAEGTAAGSPLSFGGAAADPPPGPEAPRERKDREPFREEGPADREPIRYLRERPERERPEREPVRERPEREPGMSVRERLA